MHSLGILPNNAVEKLLVVTNFSFLETQDVIILNTNTVLPTCHIPSSHGA